MMVGAEFLEQVSKLQVASYVGVEDFADKFNFLITVLVIMLCTTTVTVKQYMMKPISCYMATDIGGRNLLDYVENYCWVQGTIPIAHSAKIPDNEKSWQELNSKKLLYYQWVPFVLGLQCILFYLPRLIWQMICYNRSGTDVQHLVTSASQAVHSNEEQRGKLVKHLAKTLEQMLFHQHLRMWAMKRKAQQLGTNHPDNMSILHSSGDQLKPAPLCESQLHMVDEDVDELRRRSKFLSRFHSGWLKFRMRVLCGRHQGSYLSGFYLFIKLLYLVNSVGQLFWMQRFLGVSASQRPYFIDVILQMMEGQDSAVILKFPRFAYCVVPLRALGSGNNYATAQCVLPVNMLNEKIYVFLWLWISLVVAINLFSLLRWLRLLINESPHHAQLRKWILLNQDNGGCIIDEEMFNRFSQTFLRRDGMLLVRMIALNAGDMMAIEVLALLWNDYLKRFSERGLNPDTNRKAVMTCSTESMHSSNLAASAPTMELDSSRSSPKIKVNEV